METSDQVDRERRLKEGKKKATWTRHLIRPQTIWIVFGTGAAILKMLRWACKLIDVFRD